MFNIMIQGGTLFVFVLKIQFRSILFSCTIRSTIQLAIAVVAELFLKSLAANIIDDFLRNIYNVINPLTLRMISMGLDRKAPEASLAPVL